MSDPTSGFAVLCDYYMRDESMPPTAPPAKPIEVVKPARKEVEPDLGPETKAEKFVRLAIDRRAKSIQRINQIGALANKSQYDYTDDQVDRIFRPIEEAIQSAKNRFAGVLDRKSQLTL